MTDSAGRRSLRLVTVVMTAAVLVGCGSSKKSSGSFDGKNAPYGNSSPATVSHSVIQHGTTTAQATTQVVGTKTIGSQTFTRLRSSNPDNPASGVEWWIDEKPGESVTLAGWDGHSTLAEGIVPPGVVTLDKPLTVSLRPTLNVPQTVSSTATVLVQGETTPRPAQATISYSLVEDNAAIETSMGTIYGCKHFSGSATAVSDLLPAVLQGQTATGEIWYHPSYGIVAFTSPLLGLGLEIADSVDCSAADGEGYAVVRKVGVVDATHRFNLSTYDDCLQQFDADKDQHAQMLLELRWADDVKAKAGPVDSLGPMLRTEFGTIFGYFPATPTNSQVSVFHPEENGQGFNYTYTFVSQAAKNESTNGIAYHIGVSVDSGASAIRATGRIYYKKYGTSAPRDAAPVSNPRDAAPVSNPPDAADSGAGGDVIAGPRDVAADAAVGDAAKDSGSSTGQEAYLLKMESVQGVSFNPPVATTFTLTGAAYITRIWTYHYNATIGSKSPTVAFKDTTSGAVYGPWAQTGYKSLNSALGAAKTDPGNVKGPPDNYWMAFPETTVPAGTYQVVDSDPTTWAYTSDLGNRGSAWVYGWYTSATPDAGTDAAKDSGPDTVSVSGSNLIVNGNAEQGAGSADGSAVAVPGWTVSGNATAVQYGCSGCVTLTDPGPPSRGVNFFAGGLSDPTSSLTQSISLASYASNIDAGKVSYVLQGYLGGYDGQDDNTVLSLSFLNANGAALGTASIGPVLSSDRGGLNALLLRSTNGSVPVGARAVTVTLTMTRASGTANDGWADDLSLVLVSGVSL